MSAASTPSKESPFEELVCSSPDALIPHNQWVHFAVGCLKPKGSDHGGVRIYINGVRVGAMRMPFPVAISPIATSAPPQLLTNNSVPPEAIRLSVGREFRGVAAGRQPNKTSDSMGQEEDNEWMLGRTLLLEEAVPEDTTLLMHHLVSQNNLSPQVLIWLSRVRDIMGTCKKR